MLEQLRQLWPPNFLLRSVSVFLIFVAVAFGSMWLAAIVRALASGGAPSVCSSRRRCVSLAIVPPMAVGIVISVVLSVAMLRAARSTTGPAQTGAN